MFFKTTARFLAIVTIVMSVLGYSVPTTEAATQNAYRWRNDDGSEAAASFSASENTALPTLVKNTGVRLRFGEANSEELLRKAAVTLGSGDNWLSSGVIDTAHGYAYFGTHTSPGRVIKVSLGSGTSAPTKVAALTLNTGENSLNSAVIDTVGGYAYFGTGTFPGIVVKVALGDGAAAPTRIDAVTLNGGGENNLTSAIIDAPNGYGYFGTATNPGKVVKVALGAGAASPTRVDVVTLNSGENSLASAVIDVGNNYGYFGTNTIPGKVIKVDLGVGVAAPTRVDVAAFSSGENGPGAAVIDAVGGYAYFATTQVAPGRIVKVALGAGAAAPTRVNALTLNSGEDNPTSGAIDVTNGFAYFGTGGNPGRVVKVALGAGAAAPTRVDTAILNTGENAIQSLVADLTNGYVYVGTFPSPAIVVKVSLVPTPAFRLEYGTKSSTCAAISSWTQVPTTATTEAFQMFDSTNITDGVATTDNTGLTNGNTTFTAGQVKDTSSQAAEMTLTTLQFTEMEYSIVATPGAADGGTYCFRLTDAGTALKTYTNYGEATLALIPRSPAPQPPSVSVVQPNAGETLNGGSTYNVVWSSNGTGISSYRLSYSADSGSTWTVVATDIAANVYGWTVPNVNIIKARLRVEALDSEGAVVATDDSNVDFTISAPAEVVTPSPTPTSPPATPPATVHDFVPVAETEASPTIDSEKNLVAAANPACVSGSLFRGTLSTVYYCGIDGKRYPFPNSQTYFTWFPDFSRVQRVTNSEMAKIPLGSYVTYKPGVRMLKLDTDSKVYGVSKGAVLRYVPDEAAAADLYGAAWNTKIDDVPLQFWSDYTIGTSIK